MLVGRQAANRHEFSDSRQRGHISKNCHSDPAERSEAGEAGEGPPSIRLQTKELHDCNACLPAGRIARRIRLASPSSASLRLNEVGWPSNIDYQYSKKSNCKDDCYFHCEMFGSRISSVLTIYLAR